MTPRDGEWDRVGCDLARCRVTLFGCRRLVLSCRRVCVCGGVAWVLVFVSSPFRWWGPWLCVGGSCLCAVKWIVKKKKKKKGKVIASQRERSRLTTSHCTVPNARRVRVSLRLRPAVPHRH
jgi:hypothetical protein